MEAIFFVHLIGHCTALPSLPSAYTQLADSDPEFFNEAGYLVGYLVTWNLLIEISVAIVVHFKHHSRHIIEHGTLNFLVVGGQLLNNLVFLASHDWRNAFVLGEALILLLVLNQTMLGLILNKKLLATELQPTIFLTRFAHKTLGRVIYLLTKYQICTYMYRFYLGSSIQPFLPIGLLLGLTLLTHLVLRLVLDRTQTSVVGISSYLVDTAPNPEPYLDLLRSIEAGDIVLEEDDFVMTTRLSEHSVDLSEDLAPQIDWVMIENKVFEITNLRHPKGNYILRAIRGRDITRQIYGIKSWRFENKETGYHKNVQHAHQSRTFEFLKDKCIGEIPLNPLVVDTTAPGRLTAKSAATINLFSAAQQGIEEKVARISGWQTQYVLPLDDSGKGRVIFARKKAGDCMANVSSYWLKNFGKYFLIRRPTGELDYLYVTLALSPKYLSEKRRWLGQLAVGTSAELSRSFDRVFSDLLGLDDILRNSLSGPARTNTDFGGDVRDAFLPLLEVTKSETTKFGIASEYSVHGPLGTGLGFNGSTTKRILIALKDEGVSPLLDFFEFMSQRALLELNKGSPEHSVFGSEYLLAFGNAPEFFIYWEISDAFVPMAEQLGLWTLQLIGHLQAGVQASQFGSATSRVLDMIKRITVVTKKPAPQAGSLVTTTMKGYDFKTIKDLASNESFGRIEMAVVSGDADFVNRVLRDADLRPTQIEVL